MIRINLRIDEGVSPCLYRSLFELPPHSRAERVRILATLGLSLEAKVGKDNGSSSATASDKSDNLADDLAEADITRIFGET